MKTSRTRWSCQIVRAARALSEESSRFGRAHVARCAACQAYFGAADALAAALRRDAAPPRAPAPTDLDQRVLAAISQTIPRRPDRQHGSRLVLALSGAVAALAVALVLVPVWRTTRPSAPSVPPVATNPAIGPELDPAILAANPFPALNASVSNALQKEPLQKEVQSVYADARSAVHFLAANFLPEPASSAPAASPTSGG